MRWLITGLNGTLAPVVARACRATGVEVLAWDRTRIDPADSTASADWLSSNRPDAILHLATGSSEWAALLADHAARHSVPFIFTSTAMVFHHEPDGPHGVDDPVTAQDDYGRSKIACERAIRRSNANAMIVRIGWQIDPHQPGNNMLRALDLWQERDGHIDASRAWTPACSFMADTAAALVTLANRPQPGIIHLDSNAEEAHDFARIVTALQSRFERPGWIVNPGAGYRHDQRLVGSSGLVPPLSARLPLEHRTTS